MMDQARTTQPLWNKPGFPTVVVLGALVIVPAFIFAAILIKNIRGEALGRWELRGDPSAGFEGEMPYPPGTNSLHLYYDAVWVGPKELPTGSIRLELLEEGRIVETSSCTTEEGGIWICNFSGGGEELGSKRRDCERRLACSFGAGPSEKPRTLRAHIEFGRPEQFRERAKFQIVLRE
jgi:hypothetical protein